MIGQTISHYTILEKPGAGGIGAVRRAEDVKLGGQGALKLLACLTHRLTAQARNTPVIASLRLSTVLDVPSSTPVRAERRAPRTDRPLPHFRSPRGEKCRLAAQLVSDPEIRKRFEREAKAAALLRHPNICHVDEIDEADGLSFLAMGEQQAAAVPLVKMKTARGWRPTTYLCEGGVCELPSRDSAVFARGLEAK